MRKIQGWIPEALHEELCGAISDLAKSVEVAVKRRALCDEIATTITRATKVANAATVLRATALPTVTSKQSPAGVICAASATQEEAQDSWARIAPVVAVAQVEETWTRVSLDALTERSEQSPLAAPIAQLPKTKGKGEDTWARMTLVLDAATSRAKDTWTGAAVVREHEPEKQAIATPILELYDRLGTFSPKR